MTTKLICPLLFFSLLALASGAPDKDVTSIKVICLYRLTSRPDSTSAVTRQELTQLAISDSLSEFRSVVRYKSDSLLLEYSNVSINSPALMQGMTAVENLPKYNFKGVVINDLKKQACLYYGMIDKVLYYYKDDNYPVTWHLLPDTASVNGYKCQKALTRLESRKYTAWFTRQVPISSGPYKFGGLPGLIVSISDATNSYKFELVRVYQPTNKLSILLPGSIIYFKQPGKLVAKREYYNSLYDYQENFIDRSVAGGMTKFDNEDGLRSSYKEKLKHRNNPIELEFKKQR